VSDEKREFVFRPIGIARTPFRERIDAPRQAVVAKEVDGTIELFSGHGFEDALDGLASFSHVWLLFVFDRNEGWNPKVLPPRRTEKVGVFASRSPYRPNPIGMSVVELVRIDGLTLHVRGIDLLDETPIVDLKPYIAYADSLPDAARGWLGDDPEPAWTVTFAPRAAEQLDWLDAYDRSGAPLRAELEARLALGPQPHAYRRIKIENGRSRIAWKDWRAFFHTEERAVVVDEVASGYRRNQLGQGGPAPETHRAFAARFQVTDAVDPVPTR
jgi:tRNA-Thr(GGU) m(6)t(6)A37 methyltransferase TsaA